MELLNFWTKGNLAGTSRHYKSPTFVRYLLISIPNNADVAIVRASEMDVKRITFCVDKQPPEIHTFR
jgi:hypothetical protein